MIDLLRLLICLGLLELYHLIYTRPLTGFEMLVFFTNSSHGISNAFGLNAFFLAIDGFDWFWMGIQRKSIQLTLLSLKAPYLILRFSCYILITALMILSVILLSMLRILFSALCEQASNL